MTRTPHSRIVPLLLAALLVASSCTDNARSPLAPDEGPNLWADQQPGTFRLTGGGRIDNFPPSTDKNTPDSRDFATFGFQARPVSSTTTEGSGNITWVEHNPDAYQGGFTFHGTVTNFYRESEPNCATFSGTGRLRTRSGLTFEDLEFIVVPACDNGEPGVGRDYINIRIGGYARQGLLTGGNIQKHKL